MGYERELKGPGAYEKYNKISIICQQRYFLIFKIQVSSLLLIALLSLLPPFPDAGYETMKHCIELLFILVVFGSMIVQYNADYMKGWQNARFLAESIISNVWLYIWKCEPFEDDRNSAQKFIDLVESLENEVDLKSFISLYQTQEGDISNWMNDFRQLEPETKKREYIKYRIDDQCNWYSKKADYNQKQSTIWFLAGIGLMVVGALLTLGIMVGYLPSWSFLGFFTTASAIVFSWSQAKRNDELKVTYGLSARELSRFKSKIEFIIGEKELSELASKIEKAISREHKLWLAGAS